MPVNKQLKSIILKSGMLAAVIAGSCLSGVASADDDCPVGLVSGKTLDEEFGPGTSDLTTCLSKRNDIKIVMQLNKSCRDSYATHPTGVNGKPTGEVSKVVNNIGNCADNRPYALGNLRNMLADLRTTNGVSDEEIDIRVVVHSGGGYVLLKDAGYDGGGNYIPEGRNKFQSQVEDLMAEGVRFFFCQNTTRGFIRSGTLPGPAMVDSTGGATAQLIDDVEYVTAGVTAISDFQEQGYRYVQP